MGLKGSGMPSWAVELPKLDGSNCSRRERNERKAGLKEAEKTGTLTGKDLTLAIGSMILLCCGYI